MPAGAALFQWSPPIPLSGCQFVGVVVPAFVSPCSSGGLLTAMRCKRKEALESLSKLEAPKQTSGWKGGGGDRRGYDFWCGVISGAARSRRYRNDVTG